MDQIDRSEFGNVLGDTSQLEFVDRSELDRDITCVCVLCLGSSLVDMTSFVSVDDMAALLSTCVDISSFESVGDKAALLAAYVDISVLVTLCWEWLLLATFVDMTMLVSLSWD